MVALISDWTVDYGKGPTPVTIPHAWNQAVPLMWEGPAHYETTITVPAAGGFLTFEGVSYLAEVRTGETLLARHIGAWDAFTVDLRKFAGKTIPVRVSVTKNGGKTMPVGEVASGFLPYVFGTFGGIFKRVTLAEKAPNLEPAKRAPALTIVGSKLLWKEKPFYLRGALHWGWYPEYGHPNPPLAMIEHEVGILQTHGFNTLKFCLWVPPHEYLDVLAERGMAAWMELPMWKVSSNPKALDAIAGELENIIKQYRRHDNILAWTVGCELSHSTPPEFRQRLVDLTSKLTGCPLVKDNSGGAEMYGGDPLEFGDFDDFHPYCDTPFYPPVIDTLLPGPRSPRPILLGEFNDYDRHRDLPRLLAEQTYWASSNPDINAQGVRWQYDLPTILAKSRWAKTDAPHDRLRANSYKQGQFMRRRVQETVRAREEFSGYVITGWRDTPISSSGIVDDWGDDRYSAQDMADWNSRTMLFLVPRRRPPWVRGGNRPGMQDAQNHFAGSTGILIGVHSDQDLRGRAVIKIVGEDGKTVAQSSPFVDCSALAPIVISDLRVDGLVAGKNYQLTADFEGNRASWSIAVESEWTEQDLAGWSVDDPLLSLEPLTATKNENTITTNLTPAHIAAAKSGATVIWLVRDGRSAPRPFFREAAYLWPEDARSSAFFEGDVWPRLWAVAGDRTLSANLASELGANQEFVHLRRVDTRTYEELSVLSEFRVGSGRIIATTLRPEGGLGAQPAGITNNPMGVRLMRMLMKL